MQDSEEPLFFRGNGATECEDFVNIVNRYAWKSGKADDTKWAAQFAMSCLSGKALRWSVQLDKNTRRDWDLLSAALLLEYTEDVEDNESELRSPAIPTPAAAPVTELIRGISNLSLEQFTGRIRVETDRPSIGGYVSRDGGDLGTLITCSDPRNAIKVHWNPGSSPHLIQILNPSVPKYNYLGVTHFSDDPKYSLFGPDSTASAALTCITKPNVQGHAKSMRTDGTGKPVSGKSRAAIWSVLVDLTIIPIVEELGCQYAMTPLVWVEDKEIVIVVNCESYMARCNLTDATGIRVKLIFEPL